MFGETGRAIRSGGTRASKISYRDYFRNDDRDDQRDYNRSQFAVFNYDNVVFESYNDAFSAARDVEKCILDYEICTVANFYEIARLSCNNYLAFNHGWTKLHLPDFHDPKIESVPDGYVIRLPKTVQID